MMDDFAVTPTRQGPPVAVSGNLESYLGICTKPQIWLTRGMRRDFYGGGDTAGYSKQQPAVRPKITNQSKGFYGQQLQ